MPPRGPKARPALNGRPRQAARPKGGPSAGASVGSVLLVQNLPLDVKPEDVSELFSVTIGPLAKPVDISYNAKGEFAGQAVVYFQAANAAVLAWEKFNEKRVDDKTPLRLYIAYATPPDVVLAPSSQLTLVQRTAAAPFSSLNTSNLAAFPTPKGPRSTQGPKAKKLVDLKARIGKPLVDLKSRIAPLPGTVGGAAGGKKVMAGGLKAAPGASKKGKKKRSGLKGKVVGMDVD